MVAFVPRRPAKGWVVAATLVVALHALLALDAARRLGGVYDETVYPAAGYAYWTTGDYRMNPEHPPLLKLLTGLGWLGTSLEVASAPGWDEALEWPFGQSLLYRSQVPAPTLLLRARLPVVLLSTAFAVALWLVARRFAGSEAAGLAALVLWALDPLVVSQAALATTDLGAAVFYFAAAVAVPAALRRGGAWITSGAGIAVGLALATKFSLLPVVALVGTLAVLEGWRRRSWRPLRVGVAVVGIAAAVLVATYGPAGPARYLDGLEFLRHHERAGHGAFAFGLYSPTGWWWYFPAAWLVKTPIPALLATCAGLAAALIGLRKEPARLGPLLLAMGLFAAPVLAADIQIGVRHLLPLSPFLALLGGTAVAGIARRRWPLRLGVAACALWLLAGTLRTHPDHLAYSNEVCGGPRETWRALADSNVDWGQDLPRLAEELARAPLKRVYLGLLSSADPWAYGVRYCRIPSFGFVPPRYEDGPEPGGREWIAVSTTNLLDVMVEGNAAYAWLRERPMTRLVGSSIALFDVTDDAEAHARIAMTALSFDDPEAALPALRRVEELAPGRWDVAEATARALAALGRRDEALAACREAARRAPDKDLGRTCDGIVEAGR